MENQDFTQKNVACKSLKEKLLKSLWDDLTPLLKDALQFSVHPTIEDAALELSRSELLFVALLQALTSKNMVMSGRLLLEAQGWELLPRLSGYMGGKLRTEFNCTNEFVGGAAAFAHTLQDSGLMKVPKRYLKYLDFLAENVREEIEARERSSRRQAGAAGGSKKADGQENQDAISKRGESTTGQESQTHDQIAPTATSSLQSATASTSLQSQIAPKTATPSVQSVVASTSLPSQALFAAVERDDPDATRSAIDSGADINGRNSCGFTPLHVAVAKGHLSAMAVLLRRGANTEVVDNSGDRPLHTAAANVMDKAVALLLVGGADLNAGDQGGLTPVQRAAGRKSTTDLLCPPANSQMGRERAASDVGTKTLRDSVVENDPQAARTAIENGADIGGRYTHGGTALHLAASIGTVEVMSALLRAGANTEAVDIHKDRPLHRAAYWGRRSTVTLLAVAGADLHSRGYRGRTPLQVAARNGHTSTAALLDSLSG